MGSVNPVIWIFGIFMTLAGCAGFWAFASLLVTRKSDKKNKDTNSLSQFEEASASFRDDLIAYADKKDAKIEKMRDAFIPLIDFMDDIAPKVWPCISDTDKVSWRSTVFNARKQL